MRWLAAVSGFVELLARLLTAQRRLVEVGLESESVSVVRGARRDSSGGTTSYYVTRSERSSNRGEVEAVARALAERCAEEDAAASFEALLPQTVALLLEYAPPTVGHALPTTASEMLTARLAESLVRACGRSSQLGLEACWALRDALDENVASASTGVDASFFGSRLARDCWRAAAREGSRDTAAFVASLVQVSESLSKVDRQKRRDKARLRPSLEALNRWLAAIPRGVRVPLAGLDTGRQVRVLRVDAQGSTVMPSRARAPVLIFCEALELPEDDRDNWNAHKYVTRFGGASTVTPVPVLLSPLRPPPQKRRLLRDDDNNNNDTSQQQQQQEGDVGASSSSSENVLQQREESRASFYSDDRKRLQRPVLRPEFGSRLLLQIYSPCWRQREEQLRRTSPFAQLPGWRLASFLVKADDEFRREILAMQTIKLLAEICELENVAKCWFHPYALICAGPRSGLLETLPDAKSLDFIKSEFVRFRRLKKPYANLGSYFDAAYPDPKDRGKAAENFARSLASYSVLCYVLDVKDRHNGNVLLDAAGHLVHIDFGYVLGRTPGSINFEDAPFKLTDDFVDVMGGYQSPAWKVFVDTFTDVLAAVAKHQAKLHALLALFFMRGHSPRRQHALHLNFLNKFHDITGPDSVRAVARGLIQEALSSERTKQYDWYQWKTNGYVI